MIKKKLRLIVFLIALMLLGGFLMYRILFSPPLIEWNFGKRHAFSLEYRSDSYNYFVNPHGSDEKMAGQFDCRMDFSLYPVKKLDDGNMLVEFSFDEIEKCSFIFNGKNLFYDQATKDAVFSGRKAALVITPEGKIPDIRFRKNEEQVFMSTVKLVAAYFRTNTRPAKNAAFEQDQNGSYKAVYSVDKNGGSCRITKKFNEYLSLLAFPSGISEYMQEHSVSISHVVENKMIKAGEGHQQTAVYNNENILIFRFEMDFTLELTGISDADKSPRLSDFSEMKSSGIGTVEMSENTQRKILEQQTKGITSSEMLKTLREFGINGKIGDKQLFIMRTVAYLKLYPERTKDLIPVFNENGFSSEGKILVMGLLASSGDSKAQEVMRTLLKSDAAKTDELYPLLLQNISLLENPDTITMDFAEKLYKTSKESGKLVSSSSLIVGSVAGKMMKQGNTAEGKKLNSMLVKDLDEAENPEKAEKLLNAIGNAGIADNVKKAAEFAESVNPRIRASVANAVRNTQTEESEKMLLNMLSDKENIVKIQAINTLAIYSLNENHLLQIKDRLHDNTLDPDQYYYLLGLLKKYTKSNPEIVKESLEEMSRHKMHPDLSSQVSNMLKKTGQ